MKKVSTWLLLAGISLVLTACSTASAGTGNGMSRSQSAGTTEIGTIENTSVKTTAAGTTAAKTTAAKINQKILIAYFTWADNTVVEHPESIDVDATTSASVLVPGNTAMMAQWIQEEAGGDLFSIQVAEPYSSDYDVCLERANEEKAADARPELSSHVEYMEDYDVIVLGFPNWWYTCPMAVFSFVEEYDLSGKTIIPFCTYGTGGMAATIRDLTKKLPDSTVKEPFGVSREEVAGSKDVVQEWIRNQLQ